jgi:hypothetical protein
VPITPQIGKASSRAEEIAWLRKRAAQCDEGSYLAMLFTTPLLDWVEERIRHDLPPNLYGEYQRAMEEANEASQLRLRCEAGDLAKLELQRRLSEMRDRVQDFQGLEVRCTNLQAQIDPLVAGRQELINRNIELLQQHGRMQQTLETIAARVTRAWLRSETILPDDLRDLLGGGAVEGTAGEGSTTDGS